jgi:hypothetical protein
MLGRRELPDRNTTGRRVGEFEPLFRWVAESGERLVRIHVIDGLRPIGLRHEGNDGAKGQTTATICRNMGPL